MKAKHSSSAVHVTVWNEFIHEQKNEQVRAIYPRGIHGAIRDFLEKEKGIEVRTATLQEPGHGLTDETLAWTDVLVWWGHKAHQDVEDSVVFRVKKRVLGGMGLIVLHSAHFSKIFTSLMGTNCSLRWREAGEKERIWNIKPAHPITRGIGDFIEIPRTEMYGERFDIPDPDEIVFISWFQGGEVFRSGCCWERGHGRIFYFRPGHETYPVYHQPEVQKVIVNAVRWAATGLKIEDRCPKVEPLENLS